MEHHWLAELVVGGGRSLCRLGGVVLILDCGQHGRCYDSGVLAHGLSICLFTGCTAQWEDCSEGEIAVTWDHLTAG